MHDVNWSTQNNHVKTSLPARLIRMRYFGELELEDFCDLLTPSEHKSYKKVKSIRPTWFPLTVDVFIAFLYRAEIAQASDEAVEEYNQSTLEKDRIAAAVWGVMQTANEKAIKSIKQKDFVKYLAVANPKNGDEFFLQINSYYSSSLKSEMTIEKLQKIATSQVEGVHKAKWLRWWNSSSLRRAVYCFLPPNFKEADLDFWLNKATFWA